MVIATAIGRSKMIKIVLRSGCLSGPASGELMIRFIANLKLGAKLSLLGVGGVVVTALALVALALARA